MPRYYFDINDGGEIFVDSAGVELANMDAAVLEARRALADMMRDAMRGTECDVVSIRIRDGAEGPVMLEMHFTTRRLDNSSQQ